MGIYNPRNTIVATSRDGNFDNGMTLSWHSPLSHSPFYYGILVAGKRKSHEMIKKSKAFCVNFLSEEMEKEAMHFGTKSGHSHNKFEEIEKEECEEINCARIKGCSAYLECELIDNIKVGDHYLMVGKVVKQAEGNKKKKLMQSNITGAYTFTTTED